MFPPLPADIQQQLEITYTVSSVTIYMTAFSKQTREGQTKDRGDY